MDLAQLVINTRSNFDWYDKLLEGVDLTDVTLDKLPLITEDILKDEYYHSNNNKLVNYFEYYTSGTSSKKRKRVLYSRQDQDIYLKQRQLIIENFCGLGYQRACADLGTGHAAATATEIFKNMGCEVESIDFTRPIAEHLEILNEFKPDIFYYAGNS